MAGTAEKKTAEPTQAKECTFLCKFCGESKPLAELVVLKQYYPQLVACKRCAINTRPAEPVEEQPEIPSEEK
jgi:transcription elongation factor Elf1